ncbi:hypothetical protein ACFVFD_11760 [Streptomyces fimicarius]|uniref:hypothetical protein n=1 Tax=Streptomyces griseus TaxID=1911 RepID=UPI0036BD25BF
MFIVLVLGAGAVGCTDGESADATHERSTGATELCGGTAISAEAAEALKVITESSRFEGSDERSTVAYAANSLIREFTSSLTTDGDICQVYAIGAVLSDRLEVTWELVDGRPERDLASKFTVLRMGERALTAVDAGSVQFACRSEKLSGSQPAHIDINVERWSPEDPEGDPEKLKDAYATVAHSFALAMAKELGCENDGGLEARPVLDPV